MGCFLGCFGNSKNQKRRSLSHESSPRNQVNEGKYDVAPLSVDFPKKLENEEIPVKSSSKLKDEGAEDLKRDDGRKKVTFDLNVKTFEELPAEEVFYDLPARKEEKQTKEELLSAKVSNGSALSPNHRYKDCTDSEDEFHDDVDNSEGDRENASTDYSTGLHNKDAVAEPESSDSLFSLSIDSRKQSSAAETGEKEVNSPMPVMKCNKKELKPASVNQNARLRNEHVDPVLTPVENISQWKAIKAKVPTPIPLSKHQAKENTNMKQNALMPTCPGAEPAFKISNQVLCTMSFGQEAAADTSLSSWLVESETTPKSKESTPSVGNSPPKRVMNTPRSNEDGPILGVLTVEDLRQFSASASSRQLRGWSASPEETPIIGTVGSYWCHTGRSAASGSSPSCQRVKNTRCKREGKGRKQRCVIALEARLDGAL